MTEVDIDIIERLADHAEAHSWMNNAFAAGLSAGDWTPRPRPTGEEHFAFARAADDIIAGATFYRIQYGDQIKHWLDLIYVTPAWRNRGVGKCLVEAIKTKTADEDVAGLMFGTGQDNTGMRNLARSTGFAIDHLVYDLSTAPRATAVLGVAS